jgi:xanthine dehydrogenase iron-sulfur cluster and FAD-binding subunit A
MTTTGLEHRLHDLHRIQVEMIRLHRAECGGTSSFVLDLIVQVKQEGEEAAAEYARCFVDGPEAES